jgi:hypothetical protein
MGWSHRCVTIGSKEDLTAMKSKKILSVLLIAFVMGALFLAAFFAASALPVQDLAEYWAAAHLVTRNPYSLQLTTDFERSLGFSSATLPMVIRNPPWAILFILPLGVLSYKTAFASWAVFSVTVLVGCARAMWSLYRPSSSLDQVLLPLFFGPTLVMLMLGQWTILVLLGIVLFLTLEERARDWFAGASLLLVFGKPHVIFLFILAVLFWSVHSKRLAIVLSGLLSLAASSLAILAINPQIFAQYFKSVGQFVGDPTPCPNLGGLLYVASGHHSLALLPQLIGTVWLMFYWRKYRGEWDWNTHGMMVLVVSVACSYYSYPYDEVLILPALMSAYARGNRRIFWMGFIGTNLGYAAYMSGFAGRFGFGPMFLSWTASAWLVTCFLSKGPSFGFKRQPVSG